MSKCYVRVLRLEEVDKFASKAAEGRKPLALTNVSFSNFASVYSMYSIHFEINRKLKFSSSSEQKELSGLFLD
jgi:hypothetical protein